MATCKIDPRKLQGLKRNLEVAEDELKKTNPGQPFNSRLRRALKYIRRALKDRGIKLVIAGLVLVPLDDVIERTVPEGSSKEKLRTVLNLVSFYLIIIGGLLTFQRRLVSVKKPRMHERMVVLVSENAHKEALRMKEELRGILPAVFAHVLAKEYIGYIFGDTIEIGKLRVYVARDFLICFRNSGFLNIFKTRFLRDKREILKLKRRQDRIGNFHTHPIKQDLTKHDALIMQMERELSMIVTFLRKGILYNTYISEGGEELLEVPVVIRTLDTIEEQYAELVNEKTPIH